MLPFNHTWVSLRTAPLWTSTSLTLGKKTSDLWPQPLLCDRGHSVAVSFLLGWQNQAGLSLGGGGRLSLDSLVKMHRAHSRNLYFLHYKMAVCQFLGQLADSEMRLSHDTVCIPGLRVKKCKALLPPAVSLGINSWNDPRMVVHWFILAECLEEFGGFQKIRLYSWLSAGLSFPRMDCWPLGWLPSFRSLSPVGPILWYKLADGDRDRRSRQTPWPQTTLQGSSCRVLANEIWVWKSFPHGPKMPWKP